jgi:tRNA nucleotidyltransferase (CCA-adding enzyme)
MNIEPSATYLINRLQDAGYEAYLVGGCVRDALLGQSPKDWDIATSATPAQVHKVLADTRIVDLGIQHGTVAAILSNQMFEITTFRSEGSYLDGRHPSEVSFVSCIEDDLARRDFTINALAYSLQKGLIDPFGGQKDLEQRLLKSVGQPQQRLSEDALRIMRALRFAATLDFSIDSELSAALHDTRRALEGIAAERIRDELMKMLVGTNVLSVLLEYPHVLAVFIPEIEPCIGFEQHSMYHCFDVWTHIAHAVSFAQPNPLVRLALLLHDLGKPAAFVLDEEGIGHFRGHDAVGAEIAAERLRALRFDNKTIKLVTALVQWHCAKFDLETIPRWLNRLGPECFSALIQVKRGDILAHSSINRQYRIEKMTRIETALNDYLATKPCIGIADLNIKGDDLLALGFEEGATLGATLHTLLEQVLDGKLVNERAALLERAMQLLT